MTILKNTSCFREHQLAEVSCDEKDCRCWFDYESKLNCILIAAQDGARKQVETAKLLKVKRSNICQREKKIIEKIKNIIDYS